MLAALVVALGGCSAAGPAGTAAGRPAPRTVSVLAASSLTEALSVVADRVEAEHPGLTVRLTFGASSTLARQAVAGAPADVLATASAATMAGASEAGAVDGTPVLLARNRLVLAVPAGNLAGVRSLADLATPDLVLGVCAPEVPCGAVATAWLAATGVSVSPDTLEPDVRALLAKLRLGELDAALVYRSDVRAAAGDAEEVPTPASAQARTDYFVARLAAAANPAAAREFVAAATGPAGARALSAAGFELP